ncbi:MAG: polysaccharide biosynthesis tyrosine autokinase [Lachnospiraceae bacterium]|nr:polysaccharide biosynthesis tyrosine autokinase [Lachnospiraceae bacterium]
MEENTVNVSGNYRSEQDDADKIDLFRLLSDMWKGVKACWWIPLLLAVATGVWSYLHVDRSYTPYYETSANVYVDMASGKNGSYQNMLSAEQMATLFPYLLQNGVLTDAIKTQMGLENEELPGSISLSVNPNTNLLTFKVSGSDPEQIHELLQAVIEVFPDTLNYIVGPTEFTLFKDMGVPTEPANKKPSELTFIKLSVKKAARVFLSVLALILLYGLTIRTISSTTEIKQYLNAPNLGSLPSVKFKKRSNRDKNQLILDNPQVPFGFGESLRIIRTRFEREAEKKGSRTVLISSTIPGEGKTTAAVNLAMSLAQKGRKVLLVDGDMRNPSIAGMLQLNSCEKGLSEILTGKIGMEDAIIRLPDSSLYVVTAGSVTRRSTDLLSSVSMEKFLAQVRDYADYVIVDTPPVMILGDSIALGKYMDGCIYVVRRDQARRHLVMDGFAQIAENGCRILGTVLNDDINAGAAYGNHYGKYGSSGKYGRYGKYGYYGKYGSYGEKESRKQ